MEQLSNKNAGLIHWVARRYLRLCAMDRAAEYEDLVQAGHIGLWKAAETYQRDAGKSWSVWAGWYIAREMRRALSSALRPVCVSLDAPIGDEDGDTLHDLKADESIPDSDEALLRAEVCRAVREAVERLPEDMGASVRAHRLEGVPCAALAEAAGVSADSIRKDIQKGLRLLRRDKELRALALDEQTNFYSHKSARQFQSDWTSTVEAAVLWREAKGGGSTLRRNR